MEKNIETNPWANPPNEIEDILLKEVFPRLKWDDILNLSVCKVNKAWRTLFMKNSLWKSVIQNELPFIDTTNTTDYCKKFFDSVASFKIIRCEHPDADFSTAVRVCPCLLPLVLNTADEHVLYYTGNKHEFIIKKATCSCHEKIASREYLQFPLICNQCHEDLKNSVDFVGRKGSPEAKRKWASGIWIHKEFQLAEEILAAKPIPNSPNQYVAITKTEPVRKLLLLTINGDKIEQEVLSKECLGDTLQISNDGKFVAAYAEKGTQGFVYNLETRANSFDFARGPYHVAISSFPVAFVTYENKEYLIAGRAWNRIDLYDPETGESLKERDITTHHLEFFWCKLYVSPDQKNLCTFGWVWHPIGTCAKFSIENWMKDDLYAMENKQLVTEGYEWDYPMCWLDNNTLAIWGDSESGMDHHGLPVVHSVTVTPRNENDVPIEPREPLWVPLGESPLVFDEYLFSLNPKGVEVVDVSDSHVLDFHNQREVSQVLCYNKFTKEVVSIKKNDTKVLILSRIQFYDK